MYWPLCAGTPNSAELKTSLPGNCSHPIAGPCSKSPFMTEFAVGALANVAVTAFGLFIATWQSPVPVQSPVQPAKLEPWSGTAWSVIIRPDKATSEQSVPQRIPSVVERTVPEPAPDFE